MIDCNLCIGASNFHEGINGMNYDQKRILFVIHKPDSRVKENCLDFIPDPYLLILSQTATGRNLSRILKECNLRWTQIYLTNIFKCTLPNDRNPTKTEYENCLKVFNTQLKNLNPRLMVVFGNRSYGLLFPEESSSMNSTKSRRRILTYQGIPSFIAPYPSSMQIEKIGRNEYEKTIEAMRRFLYPV